MTKSFPNTKQTTDSKTCGPNCLLNAYQNLNLDTSLNSILKDLGVTKDTPTYLPQLARHANQQKLDTLILSSCTYNLSPDWKNKKTSEIVDLLKKWVIYHDKDKWHTNALHLLFYLQEGGILKIVDLSTNLIDQHLDKNYTIISCLEESWLWGKRKISGKSEYDSIQGHSRGHFVAIYNHTKTHYQISDPYPTKIKGRDGLYSVSKDKLLISTLVWGGQLLAIKK